MVYRLLLHPRAGFAGANTLPAQYELRHQGQEFGLSEPESSESNSAVR